jgi:hypothetical protein
MLLAEEPNFPSEFDPLFGYRSDYKGLGVFVYRSEAQGQWVSEARMISAVYFGNLELRVEQNSQLDEFG